MQLLLRNLIGLKSENLDFSFLCMLIPFSLNCHIRLNNNLYFRSPFDRLFVSYDKLTP